MSNNKTKTALIVVDVQNDFCPDGALAVPNGHEVIEVVNYLTAHKHFDLRIFTQDWHPKDHCSFASNHLGKKVFETVTLNDGISQTLWPDHGVQNTDGAKFHPALVMRCDKIIQKGMNSDIDSYSTFWDNAEANATGLFNYLTENDITDVFIMGLATEYCVKFTVMDAVNLGFTTHVVLDGCRAVNNTDGEKAFKEMKNATAILVISDEIDV